MSNRRRAPVRLAVAGALAVVALGSSATAQPSDRPADAAIPLSPPDVSAGSSAAWVPINLIVPKSIEPLVMSTLRRSSTFRRQCARLARHPEVVVRVNLTDAIREGMARSRVERRRDGLTVAVLIGMLGPSAYVELLAHELEHVLEQLDGTDLARLARHRVDGVVKRGGQYETTRAESVGRAVAHEARP